MATHEARALLSDTISREDAVFNLSRTALLVHALTTGAVSELRAATADRLHQPARGAAMPALFPVIDAAIAAGAHCMPVPLLVHSSCHNRRLSDRFGLTNTLILSSPILNPA